MAAGQVLIPFRFMSMVGHFIACLMVFWTRGDNVRAGLPLRYTPAQYEGAEASCARARAARAARAVCARARMRLPSMRASANQRHHHPGAAAASSLRCH
mmetsp:Transcript_4727/g.12148  ORF Transcript_4727/g.12148 Transcript_4727/m.12148 type:complete len:99 (-) Transcript_4727:522-818(-)